MSMTNIPGISGSQYPSMQTNNYCLPYLQLGDFSVVFLNILAIKQGWLDSTCA